MSTSEPLTRLDIVPQDFLTCPDEACGAIGVLMLPDGSLVCSAPDCCALRGEWVRPPRDPGLDLPDKSEPVRVPLVHHGDRITGERHTQRCLDWKDGDTSSRDPLDITCDGCLDEVFP